MTDLRKATRENLEILVEGIKAKLNMVNAAVMRPEDFELSRYDELLELYDLVQRKPTFSISEMTAIVEELGNLRKQPE